MSVPQLRKRFRHPSWQSKSCRNRTRRLASRTRTVSDSMCFRCRRRPCRYFSDISAVLSHLVPLAGHGQVTEYQSSAGKPWGRACVSVTHVRDKSKNRQVIASVTEWGLSALVDVSSRCMCGMVHL